MKAVVVAPGEGRFIAVGSAGTGVTVKVSAAETDGLCTVWEGRVLPGTVGAGPHSHHGRDKFFYVLKGEVVLRVGHESHTAQAGTFVFIPRETIHGFHNASEESATLGSSPADDPGIGGAGFESTNDEDGTVLRLALNRRLRTSVECGGATP